MLDALSSDDFRPRIGVPHRLTPPEGEPFDAVLTAVTDHPDPNAPRPPFSLDFLAPPGTMAGQGMFLVEAEGTDALELFLVPHGPVPGGDGMVYGVVFN